jgi:hypothetical protein
MLLREGERERERGRERQQVMGPWSKGVRLVGQREGGTSGETDVSFRICTKQNTIQFWVSLEIVKYACSSFR